MAIGVGTMIAAGIFVLSGLAVSEVGTVAIVSFVLAALVASITAGADAEEQLADIAAAFEESGVDLETRVIEHDDVVEALVEAVEDHDLTIIGSSREGVLQKLVFGPIPEAIGDRVRATTLMVRRDVGTVSRFQRYIGGD